MMADGSLPGVVPPAGCPDPVGDAWEAPPGVPASPALHVDGFDGPLDLLVALAEQARIDLGQIPIGAAITQFLDALARVQAQVPLERRAGWHVLAARLLVLRSRLLVAASPEAAAEAEQAAAREVARVREVQMMQAAAAWLQARPQLGLEVFARRRREHDPRVASTLRLMEACLAVLRERDAAVPDAVVSLPRTSVVFPLPAAIARLRKLLRRARRPRPLAALLPRLPTQRPSPPWLPRAAVASTLLAALELARGEGIRLDQDHAFAPIMVWRPGKSSHRRP